MVASNVKYPAQSEEDGTEPSSWDRAVNADKGLFLLLLYDKAIKCMDESMQLIDEGHMIAKGEKLIQAQDIVLELSDALDKGAGEIATNLERLYLYIYRRLIRGNVRLDVVAIREARALMEDLYGAWQAIILGGDSTRWPSPEKALSCLKPRRYGGLAA